MREPRVWVAINHYFIIITHFFFFFTGALHSPILLFIPRKKKEKKEMFEPVNAANQPTYSIRQQDDHISQSSYMLLRLLETSRSHWLRLLL